LSAPSEPKAEIGDKLTDLGNSEWGLNVIRTIWLGLTFLVILAAVASFRFAYGNFDASNVSRPKFDRIVIARTVHHSVANTAPLRVAYVPAASADGEFAKPELDLDPIEPLLRVPPAIVATSPPWREPSSFETRTTKGQKIRRKDAELAEPEQDAVEPLLRVPPAIAGSSSPPWRDLSSFATQQKDQKIRRRGAKKEATADKDQVAAEPKACQLEDFDALRWAFSLPTGCFSGASFL
jgi:hypothetical protein